MLANDIVELMEIKIRTGNYISHKKYQEGTEYLDSNEDHMKGHNMVRLAAMICPRGSLRRFSRCLTQLGLSQLCHMCFTAQQQLFPSIN